jgi:threonine dehydrogenase-like Zn-dependent dehydrogenase
MTRRNAPGELLAIERMASTRYEVVRRPLRSESEPSVHLRVELAGLCGTDIQIIRGLRDEIAQVHGHEALCTVIAVDPGLATELAVGDAVVINPTSAEDPGFLLGHNIPGVFQSQMSFTADVLERGQLVRLPVVPPGPTAVLIEPLACVLYSLSILGSMKPARFAIIGDGVVGRLAQIVLAQQQLSPELVRVIGRSDFAALRAGSRHDLDDFLGAERTRIIVATPRDSTIGCVEHVLENSGSESMIDVIGGFDAPKAGLLHQICQTRAANVCGTPRPALTYRHERGLRGAVLVTGHRGVATGHLIDAARLLHERPSDFEHLITHLVEPGEAAQIFTEMAQNGTREYQGRRILKMAIRMSDTEGQI